MSLESVKKYFSQYNMETRIIELENSTATVKEASRAHDVEPGQIGKTLSFKVNEKPVLIVVAGDARIDNKKYKSFFGKKAKMLTFNEALEYTGHKLGGICPFGLKEEIDTYLDMSMKSYSEIIPAAGSSNSSIRLSIRELEKYSNFKEWIDVSQDS